jgi:hypothetical protein
MLQRMSAKTRVLQMPEREKLRKRHLRNFTVDPETPRGSRVMADNYSSVRGKPRIQLAQACPMLKRILSRGCRLLQKPVGAAPVCDDFHDKSPNLPTLYHKPPQKIHFLQVYSVPNPPIYRKYQ